MTDCPRAGKLFGGCKFSARYDIGSAEFPEYSGPAGSIAATMEVSKSRTYVRDVCERCGKTIERAP